MGLFDSLFKSRKSTITQDPMLTPQQLQAQNFLSQLGQTGSAGGITLGDPYQGSLGSFNMTPVESTAQSSLMDLLNAGTPQGIGTARDVLTGMATQKFNPDDPSSGFAAYARQVARATGQANDVLNREAAISGDRLGSRLLGAKTDLAERQGDTLATKLADLFNASQNRSLAAAQGLGNLESQAQGMDLAKIGAGMQYGDLGRLLQNAQAQAQMQEWQRARDEKLQQIGINQSLFNKNVPYGQMSTTTNAPSIFSSLLGQVSPILGSYNTAKYGAQNAPNQSSLADLMKIVMSLM